MKDHLVELFTDLVMYGVCVTDENGDRVDPRVYKCINDNVLEPYKLREIEEDENGGL